jgi:energy-coupling factor transporter ATP-binding protein EcfA2
MLQQYLKNNNDFTCKFLLGRNGSGKTYRLNEIYKNDPNKVLLITEEGELKTEVAKNKVRVELEKKRYIISTGERIPGSRSTDDSHKIEPIDDRILPLLYFCNAELQKLEEIKFKSKGQEKIRNMLNVLYSTCLNSITIVLFDEPENFLDDFFIKVVSNLIELLCDSKIKIVIATHNPRLCELCEASINDILMLNLELIEGNITYTEKSITENDIELASASIYDSIGQIMKDKGHCINQGGAIANKLKLYENSKVFKSYLTHVLKSEHFYRALFYRKIYIVEGQTEINVVRSLKREMPNSSCFFSTDGKAFMPIFTWIFSSLGKRITILLDSDRRKPSNFDTGIAITEYFENNYQQQAKIFEFDLESHFGINDEQFQNDNSLPKWGMIKPLAAESHFSIESNKRSFLDFIDS